MLTSLHSLFYFTGECHRFSDVLNKYARTHKQVRTPFQRKKLLLSLILPTEDKK